MVIRSSSSSSSRRSVGGGGDGGSHQSVFYQLNLIDWDGSDLRRRELVFAGTYEGILYGGKRFQRCEYLHSICRDSNHCRVAILVVQSQTFPT